MVILYGIIYSDRSLHKVFILSLSKINLHNYIGTTVYQNRQTAIEELLAANNSLALRHR